MIKELRISNFKSIKEISMTTSKYNVFIGEPNVGKSNIIESLSMISSLFFYNYADANTMISKDFVRFNNIFNLFYDNSPKNQVEIDFDNYRYSLSFRDDTVNLDIQNIQNREVLTNMFTARLQNSGKSISYSESNYNIIKNKLPSIKYYRFRPLTSFGSQKFEYLIPPFGRNLMTIIQSNPDLRELFASLLEPYGFKLMIRPQQNEIELLKEEGGITTAYPFNLSAETFQYLFLIISALKTNKNSIILLEEPETHLFAYYTKFLAEALAQDVSDNQFFTTTHNPYFLSSIMEKTPKNDLSLFVVYFEDYETKVKKMNEDDIENILSWEEMFLNLDEFLE